MVTSRGTVPTSKRDGATSGSCRSWLKVKFLPKTLLGLNRPLSESKAESWVPAGTRPSNWIADCEAASDASETRVVWVRSR